ncbi:hypothetical protein [Achromobacter sp. RTa]|uniref:hypothetical protein n=1 Tax=Achromobacter sp. RTa TaxID=1532557 RepID=UPI0012E0BA0F|nr:hypothetical protein [Achromobacter sp. RTa]
MEFSLLMAPSTNVPGKSINARHTIVPNATKPAGCRFPSVYAALRNRRNTSYISFCNLLRQLDHTRNHRKRRKNRRPNSSPP